jgi:hypothetical protein
MLLLTLGVRVPQVDTTGNAEIILGDYIFLSSYLEFQLLKYSYSPPWKPQMLNSINRLGSVAEK